MAIRIEVYKKIKHNGLEEQRTLLAQVEVANRPGMYETKIGKLGINYRISSGGRAQVVLTGYCPTLRMIGPNHYERGIPLNGNTGVQPLRYNKEIVVFVERAERGG